MTTSNVGKDADPLELSFVSGRSMKWYNHFGYRSGSFS